MEGNSSHSIAAILVNYRSAVETLETVNKLLSRPAGPAVFVVENASGGEDLELLRDRLPSGVSLIASETNRGFSGGIGLAMPLVEAAYVLILNPDARLEPEALDRMAAFLDARPRAAAVGPAFLEQDGGLLSSGRRLLTPWRMLAAQLNRWSVVIPIPVPPGPFRADWLVGACILFRREALLQARGFDERYFLYFEEADLCRRLSDLGWEIWSLPEAECLHEHAPSAARSGEAQLGREILRYFLPSRRLYLARFHGRAGALLVDLGSLVLAAASWLLNSLLRRRPRAAFRRRRAELLFKEYARELGLVRQSSGLRERR